MFDEGSDPDAYLFHYTTRGAALGNILPLGQLRLSPLAWTNDPREFQPWMFSFADRSEQGPFGAVADQMRAIDERIRGTTKLVCLTRTDPKLKAWDGKDYARGWAHSRMWDQYAEGHRGVCIAFDREKLAKQMRATLTDGVLWDNPVTYTDNLLLGSFLAHAISRPDLERLGVEELAEQHVAQYWQFLFFLKARDWESEWEYRWVYRDKQPGPVFMSVGDALAGVMVGSQFPEADVPLLRHLSARLGFVMAGCSWRNGYPSSYYLGPEGHSSD